MRHKEKGVYALQSKATGQRYIGSSADMVNRKARHRSRLRKGDHTNPRLQAHANIYGVNDLQFVVLEFCPEDLLQQREAHWIDTLKPEFNYDTHDGQGWRRSEETRQRLSEAAAKQRHTPEAKRKMSTKRKGKTPDEVTRHKMSVARKMYYLNKGRNPDGYTGK